MIHILCDVTWSWCRPEDAYRIKTNFIDGPCVIVKFK